MSYLGYPRLHFSGGFLADPSTINNTPNNYADNNQPIDQLELYWNPNGTGIFDLKNCKVTKVVYGPDQQATTSDQDPIIGQALVAVYAKAPAKLVDLDPDQQNVSEIWGLSLQVAGLGANPKSIANFVRGDYVEGSYNAIWGQSLKGPKSSASGCGVYQSQLKNLAWDIDSAPKSKYLSALQRVSAEQLSINFVVNAHNNSPPIYAFNQATFTALATTPYNIPNAILAKLLPMQGYIMNKGGKAGNVPTESYVSHELNRLLGQADANTYIQSILNGTQQGYNPGNIDTSFPTGLVTGTIGPQINTLPIYYTPSRALAPAKDSHCNFAPFEVSQVNGSASITLNLGNALPTNKPGFDVATDSLGSLKLVYFDQHQQTEISLKNAVTVAELPSNLSAAMQNSAGIIELSVDSTVLPESTSAIQANTDIFSMPLGIVGDNNGMPTILLQENLYGYNVRADKFVFRMNPGVATSLQQPYGEAAEVRFYVTKFGKAAPNICLDTYKLDQAQAILYTSKTLGTSGTQGIKNISVPPEALQLQAKNGSGNEPDTAKTTLTTDSKGVAELNLLATNPGSPRADQNVDGQVYFIRYNFTDPDIAASFNQDENDLISVQVYEQLTIPAQPTWQNCIKNILPQYAKLYPIMGRFQLDSYQSVYENRNAIKTVLSKPMSDPLHMPVVRDLSITRRNAILSWIESGAAE